jgi:gliding motility-associated-like protein
MSVIQKIALFTSLFLLLPIQIKATHNRAGEITYKHISGYSYEFTVTTYTYAPSSADRSELPVNWGDGTSSVIARTTYTNLPNDYRFNTYIAQHTFPGAGTYQVLMQDPNRNLGVKNIPNSVNTIFSIKTIMLIGPFAGTNSTPVLLNRPIDKAAKNHVFIHNPAAYDPDGDSISYELTICTAENGVQIQSYSYPPASDSLYIESLTGDLIWDTPIDTGVYNIAIFVDEWRDGLKIGRITRDMQIDVYNTDNNPPINQEIDDFCVEAGDTIEFTVTTTDADNDQIVQEMVGPPIYDKNATFEFIEGGAGYSTSKFTWITNCTDARQQPYTMVLKSEDNVSDISLVDITSFFIKVLPNAPENLLAKPGSDSIRIEWDVSTCGYPIGYKVYRRIDPYNFIAGYCENGVPSYTGYQLIGTVYKRENNFFTDDANGQGLVPGYEYCYMITAIYSDGAESFASDEICTTLIPGVPAMLGVSVLKDDNAAGEIAVTWATPLNFDTVDDGPYQYEVYRQSPTETNYTKIATIPTIDLTDTVYIDQNINTLKFPYFYSVKLLYYDDINSQWVTHPESEVGSSLYLDLSGADNTISIEMIKRAPWLNYAFDIFRKKEVAVVFDSIGSSTTPNYIDTELPNLTPFTYRARSYSERPINNKTYQTINISHINTTSAIDSFPPCPPIPKVVSVCDSSYNVLSWISPQTICGDNDIIEYRIYYRPRLNGEFQLIEEQNAPDTTFIHNRNLETLAAVYGIAAVDSFNNVSDIAEVIIDSCIMYDLPNVFSPGGDGINDTYIAWNMGGFIQQVNMNIFNRYGQVVFSTTDPDINWDGYNKNGQLVTTGVYYYICELYEPRLTGTVQRNLKGFIHVFSGNENKRLKE